MTNPRICLIHGAATTADVWRPVLDELAKVLPNAQVSCPQRAYSGSLDREIDALENIAIDAAVVGVSGGATLALELAARGVPFRAAIVHEPAVGSLVPGLLDAVISAYASGGVAAFGSALYGERWQPEMAPPDPDAVSRDLAMFRGFEPQAARAGSGPVVVTVGALSPAPRQEASRQLTARFGYPARTLAGCSHAVHLEQPRLLAELVREVVIRPVGPAAP